MQADRVYGNDDLLAFKEEMSDATERLIDQMEVAGVFK